MPHIQNIDFMYREPNRQTTKPLAPVTDFEQLEAHAAAADALKNYHMQYVRNDLSQVLGCANAERCEKNKAEILDHYLFSQKRSFELSKKKGQSVPTEEALKTEFLACCNDLVRYIWVEAVLQMKKSKGEFKNDYSMYRYVKDAAQSLYDIKIR